MVLYKSGKKKSMWLPEESSQHLTQRIELEYRKKIDCLLLSSHNLDKNI